MNIVFMNRFVEAIMTGVEFDEVDNNSKTLIEIDKNNNMVNFRANMVILFSFSFI